MIILAVGIVIGALIVGYLQSTLTSLSGLSQEASATINQAFANVYVGLTKLTHLIKVCGALPQTKTYLSWAKTKIKGKRDGSLHRLIVVEYYR